MKWFLLILLALCGVAQAIDPLPAPYSIYIVTPGVPVDTYYPTYFFDRITVCPATGSPSLYESGGKGIVLLESGGFFKSREPRPVAIAFRYGPKVYETVPPVDPYDPGDQVTFYVDDDTIFGDSLEECSVTLL